MKRVVVGMSGGVDSSVAGYLLKEQGYDVIGVFMKNWDETDENGECTAEDDYADAKSVCLKMGIPFYSVNFVQEYWDNVFTYFLEEYKKGRTPNPDVLCNSEIKFKCFLEYAQKTFDADYIATGHYVRNEVTADSVKLLRGLDRNKDQSYFLSLLSKEQVGSALFPIGGMEKPEVRKIASSLNLRTAEKKDSTGICFIGERNFTKFLKTYLPAQKGDIVDIDTGKVIGTHSGLMYYTIAQRRGLGIGNLGSGERWYVAKKDLEKNILYVACGHDNPHLFTNGFESDSINLINDTDEKVINCTVQYRYRQKEIPCTLVLENGGCKVTFDEPQVGVAEGQIGVFYDGEVCLGGAVTDRAIV